MNGTQKDSNEQNKKEDTEKRSTNRSENSNASHRNGNEKDQEENGGSGEKKGTSGREELSQSLPSHILAKLRKTIQDCFDKRLFESAVFFADKLVTMGNYQPEDVKNQIQKKKDFKLKTCFMLEFI